jgi:hypothetical protein
MSTHLQGKGYRMTLCGCAVSKKSIVEKDADCLSCRRVHAAQNPQTELAMKPCPFCASTRLAPPYVGSGVGFFVSCIDCGCEGPKVPAPIGKRPISTDLRANYDRVFLEANQKSIELWNAAARA